MTRLVGLVCAAVPLLALGGEPLAHLLDLADPVRTVAAPWAPARPGLPLGADALGRDVAARVLAGGGELTVLAVGAAALATAIGTAAGLWTGWHHGRAARVGTATADLLLALPLLLLALLAAIALPGPVAVLAGTVLGGAPLTQRVVADSTRQLRGAGYVDAALARGERGAAILARELLPAQAGVVGAELGVRTVLALQLAAALAVLGFGPPPPEPHWAIMVRENLSGLPLNPAAVAAPAAALALLACAVAVLSRISGGAR